MVQRIYNYTGQPGPAAPVVPAPAPATPAPAAPTPGKLIGAVQQMSPEEFQKVFAEIWKTDPRLAYNLGDYNVGGQQPFQQSQKWIAKNYFGVTDDEFDYWGSSDPRGNSAGMRKYNQWINSSNPMGSNAHSMTPQEKHWINQQIAKIRGGTAPTAASLANPGGYNNGVIDNWNPMTLTLNDAYNGTYQDGKGGAYNPAMLINGYEGVAPTGTTTNSNIALRNTADWRPPEGNPSYRPGGPVAKLPGRAGGAPMAPPPAVPNPGPSVGPGVQVPTTVNTGTTPTNPAGNTGGYRYNPTGTRINRS